MILKSIEGNDKGICEYFLPEIKEKETKLGESYESVRETLFQSNFKITQKNDPRRDRSLGRSIRFSRKGPTNSIEKRYNSKDFTKSLKLARRDISGDSRYKTLLRNKKQYLNSIPKV